MKKNSQLELYALLSSQSWRKIVNKSQTDRVGSFEKQGRVPSEWSTSVPIIHTRAREQA